MNDLQKQYSIIIHSLVNLENIDFHNGDLGYGLSNYIAKYSLAKDKYYISKEAYNLIQELFDNIPNPLIRSSKQKNGFTYDHAIPVNKVKNKLLELTNKSLESVQNVLKASDYVTIITTFENDLLTQNGLKQRLPGDIEWTSEVDPFIRYITSDISIMNELIVPMRGAIIR